MCVAIYRPAGVVLAETDLYMAYAENPDGCGFAIRGKDRVQVYRGLWSFEEFMSRYERHADKEMLVHFRWASMGARHTSNTHPIPFGPHAMIHNGHMARWGNKDVSDTVHYTRAVMAPLMRRCPGIVQQGSMRQLLERDIGPSKMVIMPHDADAVILNEALGIWDENGAWYSQLHYRDAGVWEYETDEEEEYDTALTGHDGCPYGEDSDGDPTREHFDSYGRRTWQRDWINNPYER